MISTLRGWRPLQAGTARAVFDFRFEISDFKLRFEILRLQIELSDFKLVCRVRLVL